MATAVIMPQGGQDIDTGRVVRWLKKAGDPVKKDEVICEVETEKTVMEVSAAEDGILLQIVVDEGEEGQVLAPIGYIGQPGEMAAPTTVEVQEIRQEPVTVAAAERNGTSQRPESERRSVRISPKARRIAVEKGVPVDQIAGTGPQGRIVSEDVLRAIEESRQAASAEVESVSGGRVVPMSRVGRVTARRMQDSKRSIPHFYVSVAVDMTEAVRFRDAYNARPGIADGERMTFNDLIVRAAALAMKVHPRINSTVKDEDNLIAWDDINIGIAVMTDTGLIVPVLEKADTLSLQATIERSRRLAAMARAGRQSVWVPARLTISNLGMYNVDNFIAIINPPEAAVLAVSSVRRQLVVYENGGFAPRDMMNVTLSMDHRIGDGVLAACFTNEIRMLLEQPDLLR
jgi:pyruvate dehydrogenase E2 component (dihydrolipoamide acetyltransferase)